MKPVRKLLQSIFDHPQRVVVLLGVIAILVAVPIVLIVFGFDRTLLPTSIDGHVYDSEGNAIEDARISTQGRETYSDDSGYFNLTDIAYGLYEVKVEKNGFATITEDIRLERFSNTAEFTMQRLEFGQLRFEISLPDDTPFYSSEFEMTLNNEPLSYDENFVAETERLLVGTYNLRIRSPYYKDIETEVEVVSGLTERTVELVPAADLVAQVKNWLTGEDLRPDSVEIRRSEVFEQLDARYISDDGTVSVSDLDITGTVALRIKEDGYHTLERSQVLKQGQNSFGTILLVPEGRIVTIKDDGLNRQVFVSDYNGRRAQNVATTALSCSRVTQNTTQALVLCGSGTYTRISLNEGTSETLASVAADAVDMQTGGGVIVAAQNDEPGKLFAMTPGSEDAVVLYDGEEDVTSVQVSADKVVFSTTNGVWMVSADGENLEQISTGQFSVMDINPSGTHALLLLPSSSGSHIWSIDLTSHEKTRMTQLPARHSYLQFVSDSEFLFVSNKSEGLDSLYAQNLNSTLSRLVRKNVTDVTLVQGTRNVTLNQDGKRYVLNIDARNLAEISL
ncbi:MAG: PEGA domain protein [candidate division WS6 bacterium OLB20]|uniref:PEGA domain protein n=1 Tax=candidate division WS6 bacterium OLB20 TaxID=1617426 RepID=A0A136LZ91_9BACT|nr:MAG: PEGA domain protein [candidate division WS6 bacterium OLB20]